MNKLLLIIIAILAVVAGAGYYFGFDHGWEGQIKNAEMMKNGNTAIVVEDDDGGTEEDEPMYSGRTDPKSYQYKNNQFGFALQYPTSIRSFEETFIVDMAEHYYSCRWYDKGHEMYQNDFYFNKTPFGLESDIEAQCSQVNLSFDEYIKKYFENFKASTAQNAKFWKISTTSGLGAYGLFWELPLHGSTPDSPQVGWHPVYSVLVDVPEGLKLNGRALRFFVNGGTRSCPNGFCEVGETTLTCSVDCKESWDAIINRIFASFTFGL
ncbi:MAG: hypothetical protein Q8P56_04390 [Candidatus Uhrbacteria bacterium]|nr:hypothetical protein [Candidatus Uhrbacteria bacterium]